MASIDGKKKKAAPDHSHTFACDQDRTRTYTKCQRSDNDKDAESACRGLESLAAGSTTGRADNSPYCFDPTLSPPPPSAAPRQVIVLMRHGDRTPVVSKLGEVDMSDLSSTWESLLPTLEEQVGIDRVHVRRMEGAGRNSYASFLGVRPWGQLTSRGLAQCRLVGQELRRRYPNARIRAFSTDFPRTIQSAASVLIGFSSTEDVPIEIQSPHEQMLLPNFDGACKRYTKLRQSRITDAKAGRLRSMMEELEAALTPIIGDRPLDAVLDFRPLCVHQGSVGVLAGVDRELLRRVEDYAGWRESVIYEDPELIKLASGRLVQFVLDTMATTGHMISLLMAHDTMLSAFLIAFGVYRQEWPLYASTVVLETANLDGVLMVRVLVNDEVRRDWEAWRDFAASARSVAMSREQYAAACEAVEADVSLHGHS